jgi:hypothetical protein
VIAIRRGCVWPSCIRVIPFVSLLGGWRVLAVCIVRDVRWSGVVFWVIRVRRSPIDRVWNAIIARVDGRDSTVWAGIIRVAPRR